MPQLTNVVLKDAAATPVDHTFKPRGIENGVTTFVESAGIPLGERRITLSQSRKTTGRVRVVLKLAFPVTSDATVNGVTRPTVVRTSYVDTTFNFDVSSTTQERADLVKFVQGLCLSTNVPLQSYLVDLEGMH